MTRAVLPPWCDEARVFALPMTLRFRGITVREGMLLHGEAGWAEWSPFREYPPVEAASWLAAAREAATQPDPAPVRAQVPVNVTVPAVDPERARELVLAAGSRTAKVKVGGDGTTLADDIARVEAVRDALGADGRVRVDANGTWDVDGALAAIRELSRFGLEYVEQPVAAVEDLARLRRELARRGIDVLIAADESIRRAEDPWLVRRLEAADVAVVKVQPLGGVRAALRMAAELGLPTVVSSALDTSVGLRSGLVLAAALPELPHACGLDTGRLLQADVVAEPLRARDGAMTVPPRPDLLPAAEHAADAETTAWWLARLAAAQDALDARERA